MALLRRHPWSRATCPWALHAGVQLRRGWAGAGEEAMVWQMPRGRLTRCRDRHACGCVREGTVHLRCRRTHAGSTLAAWVEVHSGRHAEQLARVSVLLDA
jgi:hypothetical protein